MNERLDADDLPELRLPSPAPPAPELAYDDELDVDDPAFRYVIKRRTPIRASGPTPDVDSPPRPGRGGGTL
jgi:hypothetical protein